MSFYSSVKLNRQVHFPIGTIGAPRKKRSGTAVELVEFHSLLPRLISRDSIVLDLGANTGQFARKMEKRFGTRCCAVEANPALVAEHQGTGNTEWFNFAITDRPGPVNLNISEHSRASRVGAPQDHGGSFVSVPGLDLDSFVQHAGLPGIDLLKVDIEGSEIAMLNACSERLLKSIPQITIEFHDFNGVTPASDVAACLERLHTLGFEAVRMSRVGHQDTLLINTNLVDITQTELFWIRHGYRNAKGLSRMVRKRLKGSNWAENYC